VYESRQELRLNPAPEILGVVPNGFKDRAMHRDNLGLSQLADVESLPDILRQMEIALFPTIRDSAYIANAAAAGLPLGIYRPGEPINDIYRKVAQAIVNAPLGGR
jgi:chromosome partitioning protein